MHHALKNRLKKKGWTDSELNKAAKIMQKAEEKKPVSHKFLGENMFWIILITMIIVNFIAALSLLPLFIVYANNIFLFLIVIVLGLCFGLLFEILIRDIEKFERKHHLALSLIIPLIAVASFFIIAFFAKIDKDWALRAGVIYAVAFILPKAVYEVILRK